MSELPAGWTAFCIRDVGGTTGGKTPSKAVPRFWNPAELPWASPKDMKTFRLKTTEDRIARLATMEAGMSVLPAGSVLMVTRSGILAHTFPVAISQVPLTINQDIKAVAPSPSLDGRYLAYALRNDEREILHSCTKAGTTVSSVETEQLENLPLPLAPLNEQKRIADKLDAVLARVDACCERLDRIPAILKRFRLSVLAAATSGKLTEDWRAEQVARAQPQAESANTVCDSAQVRYTASGVSESAASGYELKAIGDLVSMKNGRAFPSSDYSNDGVRLLRPGNLHQSGIVDWASRNTAYLPETYARQFPNFVLGGGELLMNLTAQSLKDDFLGRVCMKTDSAPAMLNQRICAFYSKLLYDVRPYLFVYFRSPIFRAYVDTLDSGTLIKHMHSKQLLAHEVPVPSEAEQSEIVRRVESLFAYADRLEARYAAARAQVDKLTPATLAKAFRGELVPQDPNDEPAAALLARLKSKPQAAPKNGQDRPRQRQRKRETA